MNLFNFKMAGVGVLALAHGSGCAVKRFAVNQLGDALALGSETTFASDDDPDLVREAVPFSLKLMESLLAESPNHRGLLLATCRGFTEYAYAFIQEDADETEARDLVAAQALKVRARKLYLRARNYGVRGLEVSHHGFATALRTNPVAAVQAARRADVPALDWTAAAWGSAIANGKDNPELVADRPIVEALIDRAFALEPDFDEGALHRALISYEMVRPGITMDEAVARARKHFAQAVAVANGKLAAPYVALAEQVCVRKQQKKEFQELLHRALAINVDEKPAARLENLVMQRRARWLLSRTDELFVD